MLKRLLKRPSLNLLAWLLLYRFLYLYLPEYCLFKQVLQALPLDSLHNVLVFLSMPVVAFSVINIVLTLSSFLWLNRPLACLFILAYGCTIFHNDLRHRHRPLDDCQYY